ncbi:pentapeptide repeat-containing protein [Rhizobium sp. GN54]|uniref:pentapeptide repeat-containing protein n=1 Tax=Rhizobium sp. GN54 TaxID=2898150 RepID=UPI001E3A45C1|nr:pentapeptide repeat-containing protein [Rhizobium sp. GN54]MCD2185203.1 pentapeptide repeat-containing protein [Rhizobium sp. GN54]
MANVIIGILVGLVIGGPLAFVITESSEINARSISLVVMTIVLVLGVGLGVITLIAQPLVKMMFGKSLASVKNVAEECIKASRTFRSGQNAAAINHAERAILEASSWFAQMQARRWLFAASVACLTAYVSVLGGVLMYRQNALVTEQNRIISIQNQLVEAQGRISQMDDFSNAMQQLQDETKSWLSMTDSQRNNARFNRQEATALSPCLMLMDYYCSEGLLPSEFLVGRIAALTASLRPYHALSDAGNASHLSDKALSPERGQILIYLAAAKPFMPLILRRADFRQADARGAAIFDNDLTGLKAPEADFHGAIFRRIRFSATDLAGADFTNATFQDSHVEGLRNTILKDAKLLNVRLCGPQAFHGADVQDLHIGGLYTCADVVGKNIDDIFEGSINFNRDNYVCRRLLYVDGIEVRERDVFYSKDYDVNKGNECT